MADIEKNSSPGAPPSAGNAIIETPFLIVGAGPAGAALACFLASYDLKGIMISAAPGTSKEPRAHITNPAAMECLRDIGLEEECMRNATAGDCMQHTRWCHSMAGEEYARVHSWGNSPSRKGDNEAASPCRHVDLPQTLLEPILVKRAITKGWKVRFDTSFVKYERNGPGGTVTSTITDGITGSMYTVRSKYLFGCDGARSQIMRQLDIPLIKEPGQGLAINVLVEADLTKYMKHRMGNLHIIAQPEKLHPEWGWLAIFRMVKPWTEWMCIFFPQPGFERFSTQPTNDEYAKRVRDFIGDESVPIKILDVSKWYINEIVAERYSDDNIFCLGDAVHRHPPLNGLGSNTCIQDAYNLAWKIAHVEQGFATPDLLQSFSVERQPIGKAVVTRANQALREHVPIWQSLGLMSPDVEERTRAHHELSAATTAGRERRKKLQDAIKYSEHEYSGIGIEMNQRYESDAVCLDDERGNPQPPPNDPVLEYQISTYPGFRLPHAWLNKRLPENAPISTLDLAGHGAFCLLTGIGGERWRQAAYEASRYLGVYINTYSIGWRQDWEDVYGDWARRREVEEDGCVLMRPDRTVCWRSMSMREDCNEALLATIKKVLGRSR